MKVVNYMSFSATPEKVLAKISPKRNRENEVILVGRAGRG